MKAPSTRPIVNLDNLPKLIVGLLDPSRDPWALVEAAEAQRECEGRVALTVTKELSILASRKAIDVNESTLVIFAAALKV